MTPSHVREVVHLVTPSHVGRLYILHRNASAEEYVLSVLSPDSLIVKHFMTLCMLELFPF